MNLLDKSRQLPHDNLKGLFNQGIGRYWPGLTKANTLKDFVVISPYTRKAIAKLKWKHKSGRAKYVGDRSKYRPHYGGGRYSD